MKTDEQDRINKLAGSTDSLYAELRSFNEKVGRAVASMKTKRLSVQNELSALKLEGGKISEKIENLESVLKLELGRFPGKIADLENRLTKSLNCLNGVFDSEEPSKPQSAPTIIHEKQ